MLRDDIEFLHIHHDRTIAYNGYDVLFSCEICSQNSRNRVPHRSLCRRKEASLPQTIGNRRGNDKLFESCIRDNGCIFRKVFPQLIGESIELDFILCCVLLDECLFRNRKYTLPVEALPLPFLSHGRKFHRTKCLKKIPRIRMKENRTPTSCFAMFHRIDIDNINPCTGRKGNIFCAGHL